MDHKIYGTFRSNIIGFDSEALKLESKSERIYFIWFEDKQLRMVIFRRKGYRLLHTGSTVMKLRCQALQRRNVQNALYVRCLNEIVEYQKNMDGVDTGDQYRTFGAVFANVTRFQKGIISLSWEYLTLS